MSASSRRTSWSTRRNWDPIIRTCSANSQQSWVSRWGFPWSSPSGPCIERAHFIPSARRTGKSLFVFLLLKSLYFPEHHVAELFSPPCTTSPVSKERDQVGEKSVGKEDEMRTQLLSIVFRDVYPNNVCWFSRTVDACYTPRTLVAFQLEFAATPNTPDSGPYNPQAGMWSSTVLPLGVSASYSGRTPGLGSWAFNGQGYLWKICRSGIKANPTPHKQVIHDFWHVFSMFCKTVHKMWTFNNHSTFGDTENRATESQLLLFLARFPASVNPHTLPGHLITHGPLKELDVFFPEQLRGRTWANLPILLHAQ